MITLKANGQLVSVHIITQLFQTHWHQTKCSKGEVSSVM